LNKKATFKGALITGALVVFFVALLGFVLSLVTSFLRSFWNIIWSWLNLEFLSLGWQSYVVCWIASALAAIGIGYALTIMKEGKFSSRIPLINWILLIKKSLKTFTERIQIVLGINPATGQIARGFSPQTFTIYSPDKSDKIELLEFCLPLAPNPSSGFQSLVPIKDIAQIDYPGKEFLSKTISFGIVGQDWAKVKDWSEFKRLKTMIEQRKALQNLPEEIQKLKKKFSKMEKTLNKK